MAHQTTQSNNYSTTAAAASSSSWPASTIPTATPTNYYSVQTEESRMSSQQRHAQDHEATTAQAELLDYYRERCAEYDRERQRLLERFNNLEVQHEELDRLRWQLQVKDEEIKELQKALSHANGYLYDEREHVLKLQAENEQLKVQEIEDRKRIQHLLSLAQPVTQEVTFFRDCRPEKLQSAASRQTSSKNNALESAATACRDASGDKGAKSANGPSERILRTVYLPSDQAEALVKKVESLEKQLKSAQELSEERRKAWEQDREQNQKSEEQRNKELKERISKLEKELKSARQSSRDATKEMLQVKQEADARVRQIEETNRDLKNERDRLKQELTKARYEASSESQAIKESTEREIANLKAEAARVTQQRDDDLRVLQNQYEEVQQNYEEQLRNNKEVIQKLRKKYVELKRRRALDMEGFTNDVIQLRRALRQLETQWALIGEALPSFEKCFNGDANIELKTDTGRSGSSKKRGSKKTRDGTDTSIPTGVYYRSSHSAHAQPLQTGVKPPHDTVERAKKNNKSHSGDKCNSSSGYFVGEVPEDDEDVDAVVKEAWDSQRLNDEMERLRKRINYLENNAKQLQ